MDKAIAWLAPHECLSCGREDALLCQICARKSLAPPEIRCYKCHRVLGHGFLCYACGLTAPFQNVYISTLYVGLAQELVHKLKFERSLAAATDIARFMAAQLPTFDPNTIVVPVPTATSHVRARGYDQAALIACEIARLKGLPYRPLLARTTQTRQVGANKAQRSLQLQNAFRLTRRAHGDPKPVLLIDDVLTTGATLESAATLLRASGYQDIAVAVFAFRQ